MEAKLKEKINNLLENWSYISPIYELYDGNSICHIITMFKIKIKDKKDYPWKNRNVKNWKEFSWGYECRIKINKKVIIKNKDFKISIKSFYKKSKKNFIDNIKKKFPSIIDIKPISSTNLKYKNIKYY